MSGAMRDGGCFMLWLRPRVRHKASTRGSDLVCLLVASSCVLSQNGMPFHGLSLGLPTCTNHLVRTPLRSIAPPSLMVGKAWS